MFVQICAGLVVGVKAIPVSIEVNIGVGIKYYIVGLPDSAIRESFQRIEAALRNNGMTMPRQKIVVNLAPADLRKEGSSYDLSIACGILAASGQIEHRGVGNYLIMGELSLDGSLKPIRGVLPLAILASSLKLSGMIVPAANVSEASAVAGLDVIGLHNIAGLQNFFNTGLRPVFVQRRVAAAGRKVVSEEMDYSSVKGQKATKRALEIAAAGGHNILLIGCPGSGKTMLAQRLPGILPPLEPDESVKTTSIHSVSGLLSEGGLVRDAPFRAPHHTITGIAMAGGGVDLRPGEISLAHNGVLFLDELPEFKHQALEVLRQPLEEGCIRITRAKHTVEYPASFMLVAAMNPCPCGNYGHGLKPCICAPGMVQRYMGRISGPLLDRIDIYIEVAPLSYKDLNSEIQVESSRTIYKRVLKARKIQQARFDQYRLLSPHGLKCSATNAHMNASMMKLYCALDDKAAEKLRDAMTFYSISGRGYYRILKVARTIADLAGCENLDLGHVLEAITFRKHPTPMITTKNP